MAFNVNSSPAHAADPNHPADGARPATGAQPSRGPAWSPVRQPLAAYVSFNLDALSRGIAAFSSPHDASESPLDREAFMNSIFAQAKHRISGAEGALGAELHRMGGLVNDASSRVGAFVAPQAGPYSFPHAGQQFYPHAGQQSYPHAGPQSYPQSDPQQHARHQAQPRYAPQERRTFRHYGEDNALSLLGGHGVSGAPGHNDHQTAPTDRREAELQEAQQEELRAFREWRAAQMAGQPPRR